MNSVESAPLESGAPKHLAARDRLAQSRERLRLAMREKQVPNANQNEHQTGDSAREWPEDLKAIPGAALVIDAINAWWTNHPVRVGGGVALELANTLVKPVAQRNPLGLMLGAFAVGGLLFWSRPWRWIARPALLAGLLPGLLPKLLGSAPIDSWMTLATSLVSQPTPAHPATTKSEMGNEAGVRDLGGQP